MKILLATMGLDIGGAETHIVELAKELAHQGHHVAIVSHGGVYVPEIQAAGITHYEAPLHRRSLRDMWSSRSVLRRVIRAERPDVVHAHARIPAFLCGTLQKRMKFPFVTTCHGVYQTSGVLKYLSNWGQWTLAVSDDIREYLITQYNVPEGRIISTINGIDTEKFSPSLTGEKVRAEFSLGDAPVIGHVSRLDAASSLAARQLIELAPRLGEALPGVRILITGGGDVYQELLARAEAVNQAMGRECLTFTGPRTDINELVAGCDLFVGVSRAALEAMSAGKPAVLSGAQGHTGLFTPELLEKAISTNFCCRTDPTATPDRLFADITAAMELSPEEKASLGAYGREVVRGHYSIQRMTADCLSAYDKVRRRKHQVLVSGYYGFSNAGDDAILEAIGQSVRAAGDDIGITVLSNDPALTRRQYGLDAVPRFRVREVLSALRKCDVLLSGGGSLLQDTTSTRSLIYYLSVIRGAQLMGKPVMLYANGIGPVRRRGNRKRVRRAVEQSTVVTLRDHSSAEELERMGVRRADLHVTADPVFYLSPEPEARGRELIARSGLPAGREFAVVSVRDWPDTGRFHQELAGLCDHLRRNYRLEILFLLMQPSKDRDASQAVRALMAEPSWLLDEVCTPRELMAALGQAKLCLAMRLHTLIFAARMAVPTIGLVYDPKVSSYLQELDLPSAGDVDSFDAQEAIRRTDRLMADYDRVLASLRRKSAALVKAAEENERLLLEMLGEK